MRKTLRRSCDACAKSKLSCDLRIPHCSRCGKRKTVCAYANQPLTATVGSDPATNSGYSYGGETNVSQSPATIPQLVLRPVSSKLDPFESYPPTRLDEAHVQTLIQHCKLGPGRADHASNTSEFCRVSPSSTILWIEVPYPTPL